MEACRWEGEEERERERERERSRPDVDGAADVAISRGADPVPPWGTGSSAHRAQMTRKAGSTIEPAPARPDGAEQSATD